ncbi:MAG TPA: hypothetical protein DF427_13235 [Moraxellaceae bacterium]|nr:hypothetical protein [Moraxellaceae bacterium]
MRFQGPALAALLLSLLLPVPAAYAAPLDPSLVPRLLLSAGRVDSRRDDTGVGTGYFLDANYTRSFLNLGVVHKDFDGETVDTAFAGVGFSNLLQLQAGMSTEGTVYRIRHDLNLTYLSDFFTGTKRNRYNISLGNRITWTVAMENYEDDERFDNFSIGFGLLY